MNKKPTGGRRVARRRAFHALALSTIFAAGGVAEARAQSQPAHTLTGNIRTHSDFQSKHLAAARDIIVYLPPGYESERRRRYPVFYMHDGQNLFDGATSFIPGQEWRVDETAERLIRAREIEPVIIVGIYNAGRERVDEYTPVRDERHKAGGRADAYGRMIVEELKPFIDAQYRTRRGAADTGLGGSSLGGLVSLYLGLRHPRVFGKLAVVSPSVWWAERAILSEVAALRKRPALRVWVDTGTAESEEAAPDARRLRDALVAEGWREGVDLKYFEAEGAKHNEAAWAERVEPILRFLFPPKK